MEKKYVLTETTATIGKTQLYRIKALRSFGDVIVGSLGGYIESEDNLSHEGNCWVYDEAKVHDHALVSGNGRIYGNTQLHDNTQVYGNGVVTGDVHLHDKAQVYGDAIIRGTSRLYNNVQIYGKGIVKGTSRIYGDIQFYPDEEAVLDSVNINYDNQRCDYSKKCECMGGDQK